MSTTLSLHHVGEVVLCGLLGGLARQDRLHSVPCKMHSDCSLLSVMRGATIGPPYLFVDNVQLAPVSFGGKTVRFDGAHGVDVLCHDGSRGLPIEAKLGRDRLTCSAFTDRFLGPLTLSTHKSPRFTGSMTAILNYRGIGDGSPLTLRTEDPSVELAPPWFLVVRAKTWDSWASERPSLSDAHVAIFEDIARAYGDATAFDALVLAQVGAGFHSAWKVFS
jgi:hypothetical protein